MTKELQEWDCNGDVSYEYYKTEGNCTSEYIDNILKEILSDYPEYYIYLGITHNPCGRWTLDYTKMLPPAFQKNNLLVVESTALFEDAHREHFEKMFVVCCYNSEAKIRAAEKLAIKIANSNRITNKTKGSNGYLKKNALFYFLYVCISRQIPLMS